MSGLPGGQYRPFSNEDALAVDLICEHKPNGIDDEMAEELIRQCPHIGGFEES